MTTQSDPNFQSIYCIIFAIDRLDTDGLAYSVMQWDRNSWKIDLFHMTASIEQHVYTNFEQKITFAIHEYGQV